MTLLTVLKEPDPRLRMKAKPVEVVDDTIRQLMDDMLETMYYENGMGLAAVQVNVHKRVIVMDLDWRGDEDEDRKPLKMANPEIIWFSEEKTLLNEGCLSVPELRPEVMRPHQVRARYLDENNIQHEIEAEGLFAKCIQHEIDHLDGKLTIDYLSPLKKQLAMKKLRKIKMYQYI